MSLQRSEDDVEVSGGVGEECWEGTKEATTTHTERVNRRTDIRLFRI